MSAFIFLVRDLLFTFTEGFRFAGILCARSFLRGADLGFLGALTRKDTCLPRAVVKATLFFLGIIASILAYYFFSHLLLQR